MRGEERRGEDRRGQESKGRGEACDAFHARFGPTHPKPEGCLRETGLQKKLCDSRKGSAARPLLSTPSGLMSD